MTVLTLSSSTPFAQGGNRLCFVHPHDPDRCIKVQRPDFTPADRRRKKGGIKRLRPVRHFDDNLEDFRVYGRLQQRLGEQLTQHLPACYGFEQTDMGPGLVSELIRDDDGAISQTLKYTLWREGDTSEHRHAIAALVHFWCEFCVPSRDLILHNLVVQRRADGGIRRIVVIDGLGAAGLVPFEWMPSSLQRRKVARKIDNLHHRVAALLKQRAPGPLPGFHGDLIHRDIPQHQGKRDV